MTAEKAIEVLIVDDDREDAMLLQRYLGRCHTIAVNSEYAANAEQAKEKLTEGHFDLIFLDHYLGGTMTSCDLLESFREDSIDVPVVIVTGQGDEKTAVELMKMGAYDYTTKDSLTTETLEKTILNTVERYRLRLSQKQANEQIRQQKELLANVIANIPHFVFWKDRDSVYRGCNENFAKAVGLDSPENIIGKTDYELPWKKQEADSFVELDKKVMETARPLLDIEEPVIDTDGRQTTLLTSKVPFKNSEGTVIGLLGIYADITERKRTEQKMAALNKELEAAVEKLTVSNHELQDFVHIMAHDMKTPLRAITMLADWLSTHYHDKIDETGREHLKLLMSRAVRMSNLIDAVLKYSEIRKTSQEPEKVNLNTLLPEVIGQLGPPEDIDISVESRLPTIACEKERITEVFHNLLSNAMKYTNEHRVQIKLNCCAEDGFWKFSVADNGPGIEEKYFDKIFKIFQTLSPRDETENTGIGLAIAKKIIELYGGNIWVESEIGNGSTFFFKLPRENNELEDAECKTHIAN